ncbi:MAG: SRPBCC domain-containing protein [Acidobacteriota bacterium]
MKTREHCHSESFATSPKKLFQLLHTPSAICEWWGAAQAIVMPETEGLWVAIWGASQDKPDYTTAADIRVFEPPRRMELENYRYRAKEGNLPFEAEFITRFEVEPEADGARLTVTQEGFPAGPEADEYFAACERGWSETFEGIRRYLGSASVD